GQTSAPVNLTVVDNAVIDGTQPVLLHATVPGWTPADVSVSVADNETTNLVLNLPTTFWEGSGVVTTAGLVRISGILPRSLTVSLGSDLAAKLAVPTSVTIPPG